MGKERLRKPAPGNSDNSPGGFDWIDREPALWPLYAEWLTSNWHRLYRRAFQNLPASLTWGDAYTAMENAVKTVSPQLAKYSSGRQLVLLNEETQKLGLSTEPVRVEEELERSLTFQRNPQFAALFKASPWCNYFANKQRILDRAGINLPYKLYPRDPEMRLAIEHVISEFGSLEISCGVPPALSHLFAVQRTLGQLDKAIRSLPADSPVRSALPEAESGLQKFSEMLQTEISKLANAPDALMIPLRVRRMQRALFYSVRRLSNPDDGPAKLAEFIQKLLKEWPQLPAGMRFDLNSHFNPVECRRILREHLCLAEGQKGQIKDFRALSYGLRAVVWREELRDSLLRLAHHARVRANQHRKGWQHLQKALEAVFSHICHKPSVEEQMRDFERANYPWMRNLTRQQRMQLLPELGNDPDHSVRDLTKKERMALALRLFGIPANGQSIPADNPDSFSTQYGRAMKAVRQELGQT